MFATITSKTRALYERRPSGLLTPNYGSPQMRGLRAWWPAVPFNNSLAVNFATDGGGYNLTNNSATFVSDPLMGSAWKFDDVATNYCEVATPVVAAVPLTLTAWFNTDDATINEVIVSLKASASTATRDLFYMYLVGTGTDNLGAATASSAAYGEALTTTSFVAGKWHHGAAVYASITSRAAFLDAVGKGTNATSLAPGTMNTTSIGRRSTSTFLYFSGYIGDVRIYNRALSDIEVYQQWSPEWRWELYYPLGRITYFFTPAAAGTTPKTFTGTDTLTMADSLAGFRTERVALSDDWNARKAA